ncbi:MAG: 3-alpha,7-alpha,12-alpha-trihydroxy-5-beta-cholest-24-enoyl-CoA hydratase [Anaerolineaceae bacterium]|nr:MAG: 3-alpha,7-alpha,12-alpha-trihydroxy-5-beta-cholest-24-enoyl-CoA hydratase [Anaerolineaceae bacterium]
MSVTLEQVQAAIGKPQAPFTYTYTPRDVALYALGVGAPADPLDPDELKFVYELSGEGFAVLPSFAVIYISQTIHDILSGRIGDIEFNPMMLVHGEQSLVIKKPLPSAGTVTCHPVIADIFDKGSGMLVLNDVVCKDESGDELAVLRSSMFIRGMGDFGGERGTSDKSDAAPDRPPDATMTEQTSPKQALIYRLSGDVNPLHADPAMAAVGGFEKPILHGLSTFGYATRAVLKHFCDNDATRLTGIKARFSKHVFPGETLVTEMWRVADSAVIFQTKSVERDEVVLSYARATIS